MSAQIADLRGQTKMAKVILTMKLMPENPEVDLEMVYSQAESMINNYTDTVEIKKEIEPVAFGLKALKVVFVVDEAKGSPDDLEKQLEGIEGVQSVETIDVRRALG